VLELALPTLRQRPAEQLAYLLDLLHRIQALDKTPRLFAFVLLRVLASYLRNLPGAEPAPRRTGASLDARAAVRVLLSTVAGYSSEQTSRARAAYAAGLESIGWRAEPNDPTFDPPAAARDLDRLDAALDALAATRPREKQRVLRGVLAAIRADAVTANEERELFRLIAIVFDCPLPPDIVL
jgi:hypothetical protein